MGYNSNSELRAIAGMSATVPSETVLNHWTSLIRYMILKYNTSPDEDIAKLIEANRVSIIYWNLKHGSETSELKATIAALSIDEKEMLSTGNEDRTVWWS